MADERRAALADAFLDLENRRTAVEQGVQAARALNPTSDLAARWEPVAEICYAASTSYLFATSPDGDADSPAPRPRNPAAIEAAVTQLSSASRAVEEFQSRNREALSRAVHSLAAVPDLAEQAVVLANEARARLGGDGARFAEYPSVSSRSAELTGAMTALDGALASANLRAVQDASGTVRSAAAALDEAIVRAPSKDQQARQAVSSVRTRVAAAKTRAERVAPTFSSLLREFNAASSADLTSNERDSRRILETAEARLVEAEVALRRADPEGALDITTAIRSDLSEADALIDTVTDRLYLLREVRRDPDVRAKAVRFKIHDAQMLAVSRGKAREWASVLDAQVDRIDRACERLTGRNPDYWSYLSELEAVAAFTAGIVARMRGQAAPTGRS